MRSPGSPADPPIGSAVTAGPWKQTDPAPVLSDVRSVPFAGSPSPQLTATPRVAVVSSDDLLLQRIRDALSSDAIAMLDGARTVFQLSERAAAASAIVLAVNTAATERTEAIRAAGARFPGTPVVVVAPATANCAHKALEAGACGLVRDMDIEGALAPAVRAICTGQVVVPRQSRRHVVRPALSHREKQALALVTAGLSNREIAARLYLAESTVKTHLSSIFGKLGVDSRSEAAALVLDPDEKLGMSVLGSPAEEPPNGSWEGGRE